MAHLNPQEFSFEKIKRVEGNSTDSSFMKSTDDFLCELITRQYSYNFTWAGLPIIQFPEDVVAMQEIIFETKPDVIVETGVARGGSLVFYASLLKLLEKKKVIGVDVKILDFNRELIEKHFLSSHIVLIEGDSTNPDTLVRIKREIGENDQILVCLDSNHSESHVSAELNLYAGMVSIGSYIVVFDSTVEELTQDQIAIFNNEYNDGDWGKGNNPGSAVRKFLENNSNFKLDPFFNSRSMVSNCRGGFLKRIK